MPAVSIETSSDAVLVITKERYEADLAQARVDGSLDSGPSAKYISELEKIITHLADTPITAENHDAFYRNMVWDLCEAKRRFRSK